MNNIGQHVDDDDDHENELNPGPLFSTLTESNVATFFDNGAIDSLIG